MARVDVRPRPISKNKSFVVDDEIVPAIKRTMTRERGISFDEENGWATGTRLWVRHKAEAWVMGLVIKNERVDKEYCVTVQDADKNSYVFMNADNSSETDDMKLLNSKTNAGINNLVELVALNEPEMLHCLESRYKVDKIYTYTGPILIALNPFKALPALYNKDVLEFYYNFGLARANFILQQVCVPDPPPHVYAIADRAYRDMMSGVQGDFAGSNVGAFNQSILISGESGAGKTESTKLIMHYLTVISAESHEITENTSVMDKVLLSNPILESFGNAKTLRNDNSSRFGKFIEMKFSKHGFLLGGFIQTYMLERVRIVSQQLGERNYHVFYQMAAGGSSSQRSRWKLTNPADFSYINQGQVQLKGGSIDDGKGFVELTNAFNSFAIKKQDQELLLDVIAALLHLGQVEFLPDQDGEGSIIGSSIVVKASLATACTLLGVSVENITKAMTTKSFTAEQSKVEKSLNRAQASDARDAVVKAVYSSFFDWLVTVINAQLVQSSHEVRAEIGILDIFGFEYFQHNSFEQLCINYANEALQQHFNSFVFEYEQKEYREEGIEWSFIEFKSNKNCLDLIDMKQKGIFSMIDDECFIPRGSDSNLASRMYSTLSSSPCFAVTISQKPKLEFSIRHYACTVTYNVKTFLDKNKNDARSEATELFAGATNLMIAKVFGEGSGGASEYHATTDHPKDGRPVMFSKVRSTVCSQFKEQLASLMKKINSTKAHYVRCIKPNDQASPDKFNRMRIVEQLKSNGALEAIKLSRSGYPFRMMHQEFYSRYRPILTPAKEKKLKSNLPRTLKTSDKENGELCILLLDILRRMLSGQTILRSDVTSAAQSGKTKVFMSKKVYDQLEAGRAKQLHEYVRRIQALARGRRFRRWYRRARLLTPRIQRAYRRHAFWVVFNKRVEKRAEMNRIRELERRMAAEQAELERFEREKNDSSLRVKREEATRAAAEKAALEARLEEERLAKKREMDQAAAAERAKSEAERLRMEAMTKQAEEKQAALRQEQAARAEAERLRLEEEERREAVERVAWRKEREAEALRELRRQEAARLAMDMERQELQARVDAGKRQLEEMRKAREDREKQEVAAREEATRRPATTTRAPEDSGLSSLGPKRFEDYDDDKLKQIASTEKPASKVLKPLMQFYHKTANDMDKTEYQEQFPSAWSSDKLLKMFQRERSERGLMTRGSTDLEVADSRDVVELLVPKEYIHNAGQVKLVKVVEGAGRSTGCNVYEGEVIEEGKKCFLRHFETNGYIAGDREAKLSRLLSTQWKLQGIGSSFPVPVLIGSFRTQNAVGADQTFRQKWTAKFKTEPPAPGDLWLVYAWDKASFKTLAVFMTPSNIQSLTSARLRGKETMDEAKWRFVRRTVHQSMGALSLVHLAGYSHEGLSPEALWLHSFSLNEISTLFVKITDFGKALKLGDFGMESKAQVRNDIRQLGIVLLELTLAMFTSTPSKAEAMEINYAINKVDVLLTKSLKATTTSRFGYKDLGVVLVSGCKGDAEKFGAFLESVLSWRGAVSMLKLVTVSGSAWDLLLKMVAPAASTQDASLSSLQSEFAGVFSDVVD